MQKKINIKETLILLSDFYKLLEHTTKDKLSTNKKDPEQFLWEIYNKMFTIIVSCENSLRLKDSLAIHLISRYTYEMFVVFLYIVLDKDKIDKRAEKFLEFKQSEFTERSWMGNKSFADLLRDIPEKQWADFHKKIYRGLSNYAHPTMDSFLLNRKGEDAEFLMIINTISLTLRTMIEVVNICCKEKIFVKNNDIPYINEKLIEFSHRGIKLYETLTK